MNRNSDLFLYEEMILLSLREKEGTVETGAWYLTATAGAVLAELLLEERIRIREDGKKKMIEVRSQSRFGDDLIDECLETIAASEKPRTIGHWMSKFANLKNLKHRAVEGLCRRKILRADEDKVLLLFTRKIYPEVDPKPEREIIERMRKAIFSESRDVEPRTAVLVSLANQTALLRTAFDKKELKERKARLEQIASGDAVSAAAQGVIEATQMAVVMVAIMPTIISTTTPGT